MSRDPDSGGTVRIQRRETPTCMVGNIAVGSCHPVMVQSMTNTDTEDAAQTADQIVTLARAGSEVVRITVNTAAAAAAVIVVLCKIILECVSGCGIAEEVVTVRYAGLDGQTVQNPILGS